MNELILAGIALKERTKDGEIENFYEFTWYVNRKIHKVVLDNLSEKLSIAWESLQKSISNYLNFEKCSFDLQSFKITQKAKKAKDAEGEVYEELSWFFNYIGIVGKFDWSQTQNQKVSFAKPTMVILPNQVIPNEEMELMHSIIDFDAVASEYIAQNLNLKIN